MATEKTKPMDTSRPLSPHLQIWRWHVTMTTSILHRATGVANTAAIVLLLAWLCALAAGAEQYAAFQALIGSAIGRLVLFGCLVSVSYHMVNGIRHLLFNLGIGLDKKTASISGWIVIVLGFIGAIKMMWLGYAALGH